MKEITIRDLYLIFTEEEQKLQVEEGWVEEGIFDHSILIKETTFKEITSRLFDNHSIEFKIWNRSIRWIDASGEKWIIMLNKEK